jgi:hypothetical protein
VAADEGLVSGPTFVLLTFALVTLPAWVLVAIVPKRQPWTYLRVAAWTWIAVLGFIGLNYFLAACRVALSV